MAHYIIQVVFFQLVFLLVYELLLKRETFFQANRCYLLLCPVIALLLPLLKIESLGALVLEAPGGAWSNIRLPEINLGNEPQVVETLPEVTLKHQQGLHVNWWLVAYLGGVVFSLVLFLKKYQNLNRLFRFRKISEKKNFRIIEVPNSHIACTFFNTVFLGDKLTEGEKPQILSHELVHVKQKHSLDLIFFEIQKIFFWFNPLVYIYQNRIATLHEFIADAQVIKSTPKNHYYEQLLNTVFHTRNITFINQFFSHSLIKKRISMLQKSKSKTIAKIKFLMVGPLMLLMLTYVACSEDNSSENIEDDTLVQYSYTLEKGKEMTEEQKGVHKKYKDFLTNNPDYVSWATIKEDKISYSVHPADEEVPPGYTKAQVGDLYIMYINFPVNANEKMNDLFGQKEIEEYGDDEIPFAIIDEVPVLPGCEELVANEERKKCISQKIALHVNRNFNTDLGKQLGLTGTNRVIVKFKIDETGKVVEVQSRAPHPNLETEAERVISTLPRMQPGKHQGKEVGVLYSLPIVFQVGE